MTVALRHLRNACAAAVLLTASSAAHAGGIYGSYGDGSSTDNPDLVHPGYDCANCEPGPPVEDFQPPFDLDWSLGLRGAYVMDNTGSRYEGAVLPSITLRQIGLRSSFAVTASAEFTKSSIEPYRIAALRLAFAAGYELDAVTTATVEGSLSFGQAAPNAPGNAANIVESPRILEGDIEASVIRDMGWFVVTPRAFAARTHYGESVITGPLIVDNSWQSSTMGGVGLRLSKHVSPGLAVFADGDVRHAVYDAPNPTLLVPLDNTEYAVRAGLRAEIDSRLEAEASIGYGMLNYVYGLPPVHGVLYDARVIARPDETVTLSADFTTALSPPGSGGGEGRISYTAGLDAAYVVNPWLVLRASADWTRTEILGTTNVETSYGGGVGADYAVSDHAEVNADYYFNHAETPPDPARESHRLTVGVTFQD